MADDGWRDRALGELDVAYRVARLLTQTEPAAEDLVQDAYLRLFERRGHVAIGTSARAHLAATLLDLARRRLGAMGQAERGAPHPLVPASVSFEGVHAREIEQALRALPVRLRFALWLRDAEGFPYEEIADALAAGVADVRETLAVARSLLSADLAAYAAAHRWTRTAP